MAATLLASVLLAVLAASASAACPGEGQTMTIAGACTKENFIAQGCDNANLDSVQNQCNQAAIDFDEITLNHYQFDNNFMDGDGRWNQETENNIAMAEDAGRLTRFADEGAKSSLINWPKYAALETYSDSYVSNFHLEDSCDLNTVMCCFTATRKPDTTLEDNADACNHNLKTSRKSNYVMRGFGTYDHTVPTYCTGYTWSENEGDVTNQYKGNGLYDISFGTFLEKGYVENIPGAPMCGCIEKMPVVTNADCRTLQVSHTITTVGGVVQVQSTDVTYSDCGGETLKDKMIEVQTGKEAEINKRIVGADQCSVVNKSFLNENFLVTRPDDDADVTRWVSPDETKWTQVAGLGLSYLPVTEFESGPRDPAFRDLVVNGGCNHDAHNDGAKYCIIRRYCESCMESHRDIYYVRLTPIPADINFLEYFMSNWKSQGNLLNVDFELYSTYDDAVARTPAARWTFCNYDSGNVGFPRDCGWRVKTDCQWNSFRRGPCGGRDPAYSFGFYVENGATA